MNKPMTLNIFLVFQVFIAVWFLFIGWQSPDPLSLVTACAWLFLTFYLLRKKKWARVLQIISGLPVLFVWSVDLIFGLNSNGEDRFLLIGAIFYAPGALLSLISLIYFNSRSVKEYFKTTIN